MIFPSNKTKIKLQYLFIGAILLILIPAIAIQSWLSYRLAQGSTTKFQEQLASEVSARIFDKVMLFFEAPKMVVHYNTEQFKNGELDIEKPQEIQRNFLLQLAEMPVLTFVSIGTVDGEYYAVSRPPFGQNRALRYVQATKDDGFLMTHYHVNDDNQRGDLIQRDTVPYDPRIRPWFKAAVEHNSTGWYPAYRYVPYDAMGIGMSAPLYNGTGNLVGVITADVALLQLSQSLSSIAKELGGIAFLFDDGDELLASSTPEQLYELKDDHSTVRVKAIDSSNNLIRVASQIILQKSELQGRTGAEINNERYLLDWRKSRLPDGPATTVVSVLPQSQFDALPRGLFINFTILGSAVVGIFLVLTIFASKWIANPLVKLAEWATRLGQGEWGEMNSRPSPIAEVESLSNALRFMSESAKNHADNLQKEVAARTAELERANIDLEKLSRTDGLTGLANRRRFDEVIAQEVARANRQKEPLALIMIDVDHFKEYNDHYGHIAGDNCLVQVASILRENLHRPGDLATRYGGEEFAVIVSNCDSREVMALAEILRKKIEQAGIEHSMSSSGVVTASFGAAALMQNENNYPEKLIKAADQALYKAKNLGRNCVEIGNI